jgi:alpha-D-xyloside xylohydrolase
MLSLPLLARPNSLIAVGDNDQRPDYDYAAGLTLLAYELADGVNASASVPTAAGQPANSWSARREGDTITVQLAGQASDWRVVLVGIRQIARAEGASLGEHPLGALLTPRDGATRLVITLE